MDDVVHIQSLRSNDVANPAPIQIEWRGWQGFASVEAVRQTAEDLFTCAAWANALEALLKLGMDGQTSAQFVSAAMVGRGREYFGHPDTLDLLPGASSFRKAGAVILKRGSHQGAVDPAEARTMGRQWFEVAEATESDSLVDEALTSLGLLNATERTRVFGYMKAVRAK